MRQNAVGLRRISWPDEPVAIGRASGPHSRAPDARCVESDHVAHPWTSGDRAGASDPRRSRGLHRDEGPRIRHPMCSSRNSGRTRIWRKPRRDPSSKEREVKHFGGFSPQYLRSRLLALIFPIVSAESSDRACPGGRRRVLHSTFGSRIPILHSFVKWTREVGKGLPRAAVRVRILPLATGFSATGRAQREPYSAASMRRR
jgi:hypothetical protein